MKYLKYFENKLDPFNEEDWDEEDNIEQMDIFLKKLQENPFIEIENSLPRIIFFCIDYPGLGKVSLDIIKFGNNRYFLSDEYSNYIEIKPSDNIIDKILSLVYPDNDNFDDIDDVNEYKEIDFDDLDIQEEESYNNIFLNWLNKMGVLDKFLELFDNSDWRTYNPNNKIKKQDINEYLEDENKYFYVYNAFDWQDDDKYSWGQIHAQWKKYLKNNE